MFDKRNRTSTVVTSQLPVAKWHEWLRDPTAADAVLARLVHNVDKLELNGRFAVQGDLEVNMKGRG